MAADIVRKAMAIAGHPIEDATDENIERAMRNFPGGWNRFWVPVRGHDCDAVLVADVAPLDKSE